MLRNLRHVRYLRGLVSEDHLFPKIKGERARFMDIAESRIFWTDLCQDERYQGHWVALEGARYDSGVPVDGQVVDVDEDLAALCARVQTADHACCAILFCDDNSSGIRRARVN